MRLAWVTRFLRGLGVITREIVRLPAYSADAERLYREMRHPVSLQPSIARNRARGRRSSSAHRVARAPSNAALSST